MLCRLCIRLVDHKANTQYKHCFNIWVMCNNYTSVSHSVQGFLSLVLVLFGFTLQHANYDYIHNGLRAICTTRHAVQHADVANGNCMATTTMLYGSCRSYSSMIMCCFCKCTTKKRDNFTSRYSSSKRFK